MLCYTTLLYYTILDYTTLHYSMLYYTAIGEAWKRHCNLVQVKGIKLPIGDYIWVQGHVATADGSDDTLAPQDVSSNIGFGACFEGKTVNDLVSRLTRLMESI